MPNQQLLDHIQRQLKLGESKEKIKSDLLANLAYGLEEKEVNETFFYIEDQPVRPQSATAGPLRGINTSLDGVRHNGKAAAALVLGIVGLIAWLIPIVGVPITIIGLILGIKGLKSPKRGIAIAGIALSTLGLLAAIVNGSIGAYMGVIGEHPFVNKFFDLFQQEKQVQPVQHETTETPAVQESTVLSQLEAQPYSNSSVGFKIYYPLGWWVDESGKFGAHVFFFNTETDQEAVNPFDSNINLTSEPFQRLSLSRYVRASKELLPGLLQDYKLVEDEKVTTANGQKAHFIGGTFTQGALKLRNLQLMVVHEDTAYVVTGTVLESTWSKYEELIKKSLLSLELQ